MSMEELCLQGKSGVWGMVVFIMCIYDELFEMLFVYILSRSGNSIDGYPGPASGDSSVCDK